MMGHSPAFESWMPTDKNMQKFGKNSDAMTHLLPVVDKNSANNMCACNGMKK
jgi:hypothetical protein